jgi:hypothetical protein
LTLSRNVIKEHLAHGSSEQARCPMCEYEGRSCVGGAHAAALREDGIRTAGQYADLLACTAAGKEEGHGK